MAIQQTFPNRQIYRDFDLNFTMNPLTKDIGVKTDANAIIQSVKNLINTNYYERAFNPSICCNIRSLLFKQSDIITRMDLKQAIVQTLSKNEPRIKIQKIIVTDLSNKNAYNVKLIFNISNSNIVHNIDLTLKRLR